MPIIDCDVVIQAGHEDTPDDATGGEGPLGKEIDWTPVVANEAVRILRQAGVDAVKETAQIKVTRQLYRCKLALFIHFDDPDIGEAGPFRWLRPLERCRCGAGMESSLQGIFPIQ
jgi:hypothetical protein